MRDEKGPDFKVLCVAVGDPHQAHVERLDQIRPHRLVEIEHFFQTYKLLEDKTVDVRRLARCRPRPRGAGRRPGTLWQGERRAGRLGAARFLAASTAQQQSAIGAQPAKQILRVVAGSREQAYPRRRALLDLSDVAQQVVLGALDQI